MTSDSDIPVLSPGTILRDHYKIIRMIAQGGMGAVYLAYDSSLDRNVAIKLNIVSHPVAIKWFQRESQILARLSHPNLPAVHEFFFDTDGKAYLVMDFVEGRNLEKTVKEQGPLPVKQVVAWLKQVFDAVKYLHANQIVHRDIKPANIIITPERKAMLVDFGIAKVIPPGSPAQRTTIAVFTPGFSPSEQYSGITDQTSDVYSLGATLYFGLTGHVPQDADRRSLSEPLILPRELRKDLSPLLESVILRAMHQNATKRYSSVADLEEALDKILVERRPPKINPVLTNRGTVAVVGILVVVLCLVWLTSSFSERQSGIPGQLGAPSTAVPVYTQVAQNSTTPTLDVVIPTPQPVTSLPPPAITPVNVGMGPETPTSTQVPMVIVAPSPTRSATPTATATVWLYQAVELLEPEDGQIIRGEFAVFEWKEQDVLTKDDRYVLVFLSDGDWKRQCICDHGKCVLNIHDVPTGYGKYQWTIRLFDEPQDRFVSPPAATRLIDWQPKPPPDPKPPDSSAPPTRRP